MERVLSNPVREACRRITENRSFKQLIIILLLVNAAVLGWETSKNITPETLNLLIMADHAILMVFVAEIGMKIVAQRGRFFQDGWNVFDFVVILISMLPFTTAFVVLRSFRILRVLRLFSMVPRLRRVVATLVASVPGIFSIVLIMLIIFYVGAVMATNLFGSHFDDWFGNVGRSMFTLFQIMTLESWSMGIVRPVMEVYPYAWSFFIPFILVATFTMLNLFVAVIVSAMDRMEVKEMRRRAEDPPDLDVTHFRKNK